MYKIIKNYNNIKFYIILQLSKIKTLVNIKNFKEKKSLIYKL